MSALDPLETLRRQYFSLLPARLITLPPPSVLSSTSGQAFLVKHLLQVYDADITQGDGNVWEAAKTARDKRTNLPEPETGYKRTFWRKVVQAVEDGLGEVDDDEAEVHESLYETLAELMAVPSSSASEPPPSHRSFIYDPPTQDESSRQVEPGGTRAITLVEEQTVLQAGTTGLRTWQVLSPGKSGQARDLTWWPALRLGSHILLHPHHLLSRFRPDQALPAPNDDLTHAESASRPLSGHTFVELGAGTGFLAVLLAQLGGEVVATDLDVENEDTTELEVGALGGVSRQAPLERLRSNVALNAAEGGHQQNVRVEALDWFDSFKAPSDRPRMWQELCDTAESASGHSVNVEKGRTVIAADVIYDPDLVPALVRTIRILFASHSSSGIAGQAIIAATVRNVDTLTLFEQVCTQEGLGVTLLDLPALDMDNPVLWDSGLDAGSEVRIMRIAPMQTHT